jgi:hypothetical protein
VIAEYDTSNWLQNLRADTEVQVRVGGQTFNAHARVLSDHSPASGAELRRVIQELSRAKYGWGDGIVVELVPQLASQSEV